MRHEYYCEKCIMMCRVRITPNAIIAPKICVLDANRICLWIDAGIV